MYLLESTLFYNYNYEMILFFEQKLYVLFQFDILISITHISAPPRPLGVTSSSGSRSRRHVDKNVYVQTASQRALLENIGFECAMQFNEFVQPTRQREAGDLDLDLDIEGATVIECSRRKRSREDEETERRTCRSCG